MKIYLFHPDRPDWPPQDWSDWAEPELEAALEDGWKRIDRTEYLLRRDEWQERRVRRFDDNPPAA